MDKQFFVLFYKFTHLAFILLCLFWQGGLWKL